MNPYTARKAMTKPYNIQNQGFMIKIRNRITKMLDKWAKYLHKEKESELLSVKPKTQKLEQMRNPKTKTCCSSKKLSSKKGKI